MNAPSRPSATHNACNDGRTLSPSVLVQRHTRCTDCQTLSNTISNVSQKELSSLQHRHAPSRTRHRLSPRVGNRLKRTKPSGAHCGGEAQSNTHTHRIRNPCIVGTGAVQAPLGGGIGRTRELGALHSGGTRLGSLAVKGRSTCCRTTGSGIVNNTCGVP